VLKKEEKILKYELNKFLLILECKLDLSGLLPGETYRWDKEKILDELRDQVEKAIHL